MSLPLVRGITRGYNNLAHGWHYRAPRSYPPRAAPEPPVKRIKLDMPPRLTRRFMRKKKKKTRRRGLGRIGRAVSLWPSSRLVKFRVVAPFVVGPDTPGSLKFHTIGINTLNDPLYSLSNQLPLGLDQWSAMYKRYAVVGGRIFVKVHNVTSTGGIAYGLTIIEPNNATTYSDASAYMELPKTKSRILSPDMDHSGLGISYSTKKIFHVKNIKDAENLHGEFSTTPTSPSRTCLAHFWHHDISATETYTLEGYLTVEFICLLTDRVLPSRSSL